MFSENIVFGRCKGTVLALALFPVPLPDPMPVFVVMPARCPGPELLLKDVIASTVFRLCTRGFVVVRPSPDDRIAFFNQLSLRR